MSEEKPDDAAEVGWDRPTFRAEVGRRFAEVVRLWPSKRAAASYAAIGDEQIKKYEDGDVKIPLEVAARVCLAQAVSLDWLVTGKGSMMLQDRAIAAERRAPPQSGDELLDEAVLRSVIKGVETYLARHGRTASPDRKPDLIMGLYRITQRRVAAGEFVGQLQDDPDFGDIVNIASSPDRSDK